MAMSEPTNPLCPDYFPHDEHARERLYPTLPPDNPISPEEVACIDAEALSEYLACEGH